jgi:hypothetical protein
VCRQRFVLVKCQSPHTWPQWVCSQDFAKTRNWPMDLFRLPTTLQRTKISKGFLRTRDASNLYRASIQRPRTRNPACKSHTASHCTKMKPNYLVWNFILTCHFCRQSTCTGPLVFLSFRYSPYDSSSDIQSMQSYLWFRHRYYHGYTCCSFCSTENWRISHFLSRQETVSNSQRRPIGERWVEGRLELLDWWGPR